MVTRRDRSAIVDDVTHHGTVSDNRPFHKANGSACQDDIVADRQRPLARLGERMAIEKQPIVEFERRVAGSVGRRAVQQVDNCLELVAARRYVDSRICGDGACC